jgi:hypothetical protein
VDCFPGAPRSSEPASNTMMENSSSSVAIVVPMYKPLLDPDEEISYRHLVHFLGGFDKYLVSPESLAVTLEGFGVKRFRDEFFHSTATYSALLISPEFYRAFSGYKYMLVYQLDSLVFSDKLLDWCAKDLDYVGAPWFSEDGADFVEESAVGNGGLSLRKIESFLRVLEARGAAAELDKYHDAICAALPWYSRLFCLPYKLGKRLSLSVAKRRDILIGTGREPPGKRLNDDCFWSFKAADYCPGFKIASGRDGLSFSFEKTQQRCFELNGGRLPFGCHAWSTYDRNFWEPFLLKYSIKKPRIART